MRVIFFHTNGIRSQAGGISRITDTLTKTFRSKGLDVILVGARNIAKDVQYDKKQFFLPKSDKIDVEENVVYMNRLIAEENIDIIINQAGLNSECVNFLSRVKKNSDVKIVNCLHNSVITPIKNLPYQWEYLLRKYGLLAVLNVFCTQFVRNILVSIFKLKERKILCKLVKNSDALITLCDGLKDEIISIVGKQYVSKIEVIPNCFIPEKRIEVPKQKVVLWVGTINFTVKRIDLMLKIWSLVSQSHSDWCLKILGDGSGLKEAKEIVKQLHLQNVFFEGRVNPVPYYEEAKIICVTSTHESFSLVCVEGMFHAVVPIVFDSYPAASIVLENGKCGCLVQPFNCASYAKKMSLLMDDNILLSELQVNGVSNVEKYFPDVIFRKWNNLFTQLNMYDKIKKESQFI